MERLQTQLTSVISLILLSSMVSVCQGAHARDQKLSNDEGWPQTRAERTDYRETSHYDDVLRYLEDLQAMGAPISVQFIGVSTQGRKIPLVIAACPPVAAPTLSLIHISEPTRPY